MALESSLSRAQYITERARLSNILQGIPAEPWTKILKTPADIRQRELMDAGDELRRLMGRGDAVALLGATYIHYVLRPSLTSRNAAKRAFIVRSLKNKNEEETLRALYGNKFVLIAAYSARDKRLEYLANQIAASRKQPLNQLNRSRAGKLVDRDEHDAQLGSDYGQNVRDTFPRADVFIDCSLDPQLQVDRFMELLLGNPYITPSRDEYAMSLARVTALRSADLGRQVGATIATPEGEVLALGTNEVPKYGGGQYWPGDPGDQRDFQQGFDANTRQKRLIIAEALQILRNQNLLSGKTQAQFDAILESAVSGEPGSPFKEARLMNLIEFGRAVHAEMAAITEAARRGVSIVGHTLYSTTFPCHECTRHIIATGLKRVVYIEPYPKSLARELHLDAVSIDGDSPTSNKIHFEPFVGVAPRLYFELFQATERKERNGNVKSWVIREAEPRLQDSLSSELMQTHEKLVIDRFREELESKLGITFA